MKRNFSSSQRRGQGTEPPFSHKWPGGSYRRRSFPSSSVVNWITDDALLPSAIGISHVSNGTSAGSPHWSGTRSLSRLRQSWGDSQWRISIKTCTNIQVAACFSVTFQQFRKRDICAGRENLMHQASVLE